MFNFFINESFITLAFILLKIVALVVPLLIIRGLEFLMSIIVPNLSNSLASKGLIGISIFSFI